MSTTYRLKRKTYSMGTDSVYDDTDDLKRMTDAEILAQEKKSKKGLVKDSGLSVVNGAATGAGIGGALGTAAAFAGKKGGYFRKAGKGAAVGAAVGAGAMALRALNKRSKEAQEVDFYNNRLEFAQRQAKRRERRDFRANMTKRDGYSF